MLLGNGYAAVVEANHVPPLLFPLSGTSACRSSGVSVTPEMVLCPFHASSRAGGGQRWPKSCEHQPPRLCPQCNTPRSPAPSKTIAARFQSSKIVGQDNQVPRPMAPAPSHPLPRTALGFFYPTSVSLLCTGFLVAVVPTSLAF